MNTSSWAEQVRCFETSGTQPTGQQCPAPSAEVLRAED